MKGMTAPMKKITWCLIYLIKENYTSYIYTAWTCLIFKPFSKTNSLIMITLVSVWFSSQDRTRRPNTLIQALPAHQLSTVRLKATSCLIWRYVPINNSWISAPLCYAVPYPLPPQMVILLYVYQTLKRMASGCLLEKH